MRVSGRITEPWVHIMPKKTGNITQTNQPQQAELVFEEVVLPAVEVRIRTSVGEIRHVIKLGERISAGARRVPLDGRRRGAVLEIASRRYLVDGAKQHSGPAVGLQGELATSNAGLHWIWHEEEQREATLLRGDVSTELRDQVRASWAGNFVYKDEATTPDRKGFRSPQLGALHALAAHWTLSTEPATIVMPTGTGKTETMISLLLTSAPNCMLVVVPSRALRDQTAEKFATLGILPKFGIALPAAQRPIVGILKKRPKNPGDLELFDRCNVVIALVHTVAQGGATAFLEEIARRCSLLVVDEAHHVEASSWNTLRGAFGTQRLVQFTATPFREDRTPIKGKMVYNFPLSRAQQDQFFKPIRFESVFEVEPGEADQAIAQKAIAALAKDLAAGRDHRVIARCWNKKRAESVFAIYQRLAADYQPVLIHSDRAEVDQRIEELRSGRSKIVVCVNMLAEGFDLPQLKIAAMHDKFKSLAVTLQFVGRVTRAGDPTLGDATVVANTGNGEVAREIQSLYDEDPDWNSLIAGISFDRIEEEKRFGEFIRNVRPLGGDLPPSEIAAKIAPQTMVPRFNAVVFRARDFNPAGLRHGLEPGHQLVRAWTLDAERLVFFVTQLVEPPVWTKNREIRDSTWNLVVLYHDQARSLLYIGSSTDSGSNQLRLAAAVGGPDVRAIKDEDVFKVFRGVGWLFLQQVGLLKQGPRNLRYSMFTGIDVRDAIERMLKGDAQKSNIYGTGFRGGAPVGIGCSRKGKIWGRDAGTLAEWKEWCNIQGDQLLSDDFDSSKLLANALTAVRVENFPDRTIWHLDWPSDLWERDDQAFGLQTARLSGPVHFWTLALLAHLPDRAGLEFSVAPAEDAASEPSRFRLEIGPAAGPNGYQVTQTSGPDVEIRVGSTRESLAAYFKDCPPIVRFTDRSELEGCSLVTPHDEPPEFDGAHVLALDWKGVDRRVESQWHADGLRMNSIQTFAIRRCVADGYDVIFDDDGKNEIADVIALKDLKDGLAVRLLHCKYSLDDDAGHRIDDIVEVTSQAVKNLKWFWSVKRLQKRMVQRYGDARAKGRERMIHGSLGTLRKLARVAELAGVTRREVIVVQPGILAAGMTAPIKSVLAAADEYIHARINAPLTLWCSE